MKRSPRVLLIDDEVAILQVLGIYLEQKGYTVEAIAKFHNYLNQLTGKELPDVIVLDILLNQENGAKIAKKIKSSPMTKKIPIVMISALPNGQKISEQAGVDAFLSKPFDLNELNQTIERLVAS